MGRYSFTEITLIYRTLDINQLTRDALLLNINSTSTRSFPLNSRVLEGEFASRIPLNHFKSARRAILASEVTAREKKERRGRRVSVSESERERDVVARNRRKEPPTSSERALVTVWKRKDGGRHRLERSDKSDKSKYGKSCRARAYPRHFGRNAATAILFLNLPIRAPRPPEPPPAAASQPATHLSTLPTLFHFGTCSDARRLSLVCRWLRSLLVGVSSCQAWRRP